LFCIIKIYFDFLNSIKPTTKDKIINKKVAFVVVKKFPVVFKGKISVINIIKKGINIFCCKLNPRLEWVFLIASIKITEKTKINKKRPNKPNSANICK